MHLANQSISPEFIVYKLDLGLMAYEPVWGLQKKIVGAKTTRPLGDVLIAVEHYPVYTVGRGRAKNHNNFNRRLISSKCADFFFVERGGDITWHGPGQMVFYPIINLMDRCIASSDFVNMLEEIVILTLNEFNIKALRKKGMRGVWVGDEKIASIGLAVTKNITYHGIAINVCPDMSFFDCINPCGLSGVQMCSMEGILKDKVSISEVKKVFLTVFSSILRSVLLSKGLEEISAFFGIGENGCPLKREPCSITTTVLA